MKRYNFTNPLFLLKIESMIRRFYILFCFVFLVACDDGDILSVDLVFDQELERCDNFEDYHLVYDTREDPSESLILVFPKNEDNNALFTTPTPVGEPHTLDLSNSNIRFIYRTYNRELESGDLCEIIPPATLSIIEDYEAGAGQVQITVTVVDDDNDGIPTEFEGLAGEAYPDGIYWDSQDTDDDGIPDYIDEDDDNDNVLTIDEIIQDDDDYSPLTHTLDTDGDVTYNHLDNDDDGDNVFTYLEDKDGDLNPRDPANYVVDEENGENVLRYLSNQSNAVEAFDDPGKRVTTFSRIVTTTITIVGIDLEILRATTVEFGTLTTNLEVTPQVFLD